MRSMVGVGMTPPKVLGTPNPASSVMISSTFGAPLGGTTRGGHQGFDCSASSLITPPNFGSGGGSCFPSIGAVAPAEPGGGAPCASAKAELVMRIAVAMAAILIVLISPIRKCLTGRYANRSGSYGTVPRG